jgi:hypothetical protein
VDATPAGTALRLDANARDAVLGYAVIDFFSTDYSIKFGTWNPRPLKKTEVKKLLQSMEEYGFRRLDHANFISIVVNKNDIDGTLSSDPYASGGLAPLKIKSVVNVPAIVKAASGQHRFHAIKTKWEKSKAELDELQSEDKKKKAKISPEEKTKRIRQIGEDMKTLRWWGVTVYDEGNSYIYIRLSDSANNNLQRRHAPGTPKSQNTCLRTASFTIT